MSTPPPAPPHNPHERIGEALALLVKAAELLKGMMPEEAPAEEAPAEEAKPDEEPAPEATPAEAPPAEEARPDEEPAPEAPAEEAPAQ